MASGTDPAKDPSADVLKILYSDGCPSVIGREPNFTSVTNGLIGKGVIELAEAKTITTQHNLNDYQRGSELVGLLNTKINESSDRLKYAKDICAVFESRDVNNAPLKRKAAEIRSKLKPISTTQEPQEEHGDKDIDGPAPVPPVEHFPELNDIGIEYRLFSDDLVEGITVLLMTATLVELQGIMGYLKPKDGNEKIIETFTDAEVGKIRFYIGKYGQYPVVVGMSASSKSHQGPTSACNVTSKLMNTVKPRYVIAVGICYGMDKSKTSSGDVIVSDLICDYISLRVGVEDTLQPHGGILPVGATLLEVFSSPIGYTHTQAGKEVTVHCGPIITGPSLVVSSKHKEQLKGLRPDALGGDMEGAGIMAAVENATYVGVEAIIIKAICDWDDGKKSEAADWKPFSSHAAARYVHHQMKKYPGIFIGNDAPEATTTTILPELLKKYDQMKDEFRKLLFSVINKALIKNSLDDVKQCLVSIEANMKSEVEAVKDKESLRALLQKYCFLSNISLLKCLARKLNVTESIDELNDKYRKISAKDLAIAEIEDHAEMKADHRKMTIEVSWNKSDVNLAKFQDELVKLFQDHSMFVSLRAVHQSWLTFECTIPVWSVALFVGIVAGAGVLIGVRQIIINNNAAYNDPDQDEDPVEPASESMTELPYGRPLPLSEDIFPKKFDIKLEKRCTPDLVQGIKVLLMTATITELTAVMGYLEPRNGHEKVVMTLVNDSSFFYVGKYGEYPVAVAMTAYGKSQQGSIEVLHFLYGIKSIINPNYIIAIGICYGMDPSEVNPADIIVSEKVCDAAMRIGAQPHTRGNDYPASRKLLGIFSTSKMMGFEMKRDDAGNSVKVKTGILISRPDLVDDAKYKELLKRACNEPDALGGEMEGAGIMSFAYRINIKAIIIKAIGDYGDGNKAGMKGWKEFAAHAAARYVHFIMKKFPGVLT